LKNKGKNCWSSCKSKQGKCEWCGSKGYCCRKGWKDKNNGCDGSFGGIGHHECVLKPGWTEKIKSDEEQMTLCQKLSIKVQSTYDLSAGTILPH